MSVITKALLPYAATMFNIPDPQPSESSGYPSPLQLLQEHPVKEVRAELCVSKHATWLDIISVAIREGHNLMASISKENLASHQRMYSRAVYLSTLQRLWFTLQT
ncbi:hypothetical protein Tco_0091042 [Tanacetum coccineum]